jgi:type VI protein secretion system component VasK
MNFWTFVILIVVIIVAGDLVKKSFKESQTDNAGKTTDKEIEELKRRLDELDNYMKHKIEKRLQAIETIVVDSEYNLEMKFKRVTGD